MIRQSLRVGLLAALALAAPAAKAACLLPGETPMVIVTFYFGESITGKPSLTAAQWATFAAKTVTPAFPDGFTVIDGKGQWLDPQTKVIGHEATKILTVAAENSPALGAKIQNVAAAYQRDFDQNSVGITTQDGCGAF